MYNTYKSIMTFKKTILIDDAICDSDSLSDNGDIHLWNL